MLFPTVVPDFVDGVAEPNNSISLVYSILPILFPVLPANPADKSTLKLIRKCTEKSESWHETWSEFEERYGALILRYLYQEFRRLSHGHYATEYDEIIKDLQQDVYIKLLTNDGQALRNFKGKTENSFLAYLHTICRHIVINFFKSSYERRVKRYPKLEEAYTSAGQSNRPSEPSSHETVDKIDSRFMREYIITRLQSGYRSRHLNRDLLIFKLFFFEGRSPQQIISALEIGLSVSGIETIVSRMKKYLEKSVRK